jgi:putative Ig domain-containing protein
LHFKEKTCSYRFSPLWFVLLSAALGLTSCGGGPAAILTTSGPSDQLRILTTTLRTGIVGQTYETQLTASGGGQPYTWSVAEGQFPPGLTMDSASGNITGTPGMPGSYSFTAEVRDSGATQQQVASQLLTVSVGVAPLDIATTILPPAVLNSPYNLPMQASGGIPPYLWLVTSGALPPGLELDAVSGKITGIPQATGTFSVTIQVSDSNTPVSVATLTIGAPVHGPG